MSDIKRYITEEKRQACLAEGGWDLVYMRESLAAGAAGNEDDAWAWLAKVKLSADTLQGIKERQGADFIREKGLNTETADKAFGKDWLCNI